MVKEILKHFGKCFCNPNQNQRGRGVVMGQGMSVTVSLSEKNNLEDQPAGQIEDVVHRFWIVADAGVPVRRC